MKGGEGGELDRLAADNRLANLVEHGLHQGGGFGARQAHLAIDGFSEGGGLAIGSRLAEALGLRLGDNITLVSPDGDVTPLEIGLDPVLRQDGGFIGADALAAKEAEKARIAREKEETRIRREAEREARARAPARRSNRETPLEAATKSVLRTAGSTLTREILRGVLGGMRRR